MLVPPSDGATGLLIFGHWRTSCALLVDHAFARVRVFNDPIVLAHARALLAGSAEGMTDYIDADLRATGSVLERAGDVLDLKQPVAVMLLGILQGIPDEDEPGAIIARLMDAVSPGSYLALSQIAGDVAADEVAEG